MAWTIIAGRSLITSWMYIRISYQKVPKKASTNRNMLGYYSSVLPFNHSVDELIKVMKPWYDNYCFAEEEYGKTTMYNSVMVLNFLDKYIRNNYDIPKNMVESNVRIDYDKVHMLIRHDKEFAHDASIIQQLVTQGFVTGKLVENFPAERINDPDNFLSLLFYFGMVTIDGDYKGVTKFIIPNEVVRDQMYTYLLDTYKENDLTYDSFNKGKLESQLAYDGNYKAYFEFIADSLKRYSSQRDKQKGEAFRAWFHLGDDQPEPVLSPYLRARQRWWLCRHLPFSALRHRQGVGQDH